MNVAIKTVAVPAIVAGLLFTAGSPAFAAPTPAREGNGSPVGAADQLDAYTGGRNSSIGWAQVDRDSPLDPHNERAVVAFVGDVDPGSFAVVESLATHEIGKPVGALRNVSFDFDTRARYARGALRLYLILDSDAVLKLPAGTCNNQIGRTPWSRADFSGATLTNSGPCSIHVSGKTYGGTYSNTKTMSALGVFAAAHPGAKVQDSYLDAARPGRYVIDRLSFGTDLLYNYGNNRAVRCQNNETRC